MKLSELLRKRSALAAQSSDLAKRAAAVSAELERVDSQLFARMKTLVVAIEGADTEDGGVPQEIAQPPPVPQAPLIPGDLFPLSRRLKPSKPRQPKLEPLIVASLKEAGKPVSRNDLYEIMMARGIQIPGKDPRANLSAHLSYSEFVTRTADGLWALKEAEPS